MTTKHISLSMKDAQLKAVEGERWEIEGYATVWKSVNVYGFSIAKGAYSEVIQGGASPKIFLNHDTNAVPIGKCVELKEDERGLFMRAELTQGVSQSSDVYHALKAGTLDGLSVGIWFNEDDFNDKRQLTKVLELPEISVCSFPADPGARVRKTLSVDEVDELIEGVSTVRELEGVLRELGLSKRQAGHLTARAKVALAQETHRDYEEQKQLEALGNALQALKQELS